MGMKQKTYKKNQNQNDRLKKLSQISFFFDKISGIGPWVCMINLGINVMWLNLYGCQAVRCKLKKGPKKLKIHF